MNYLKLIDIYYALPKIRSPNIIKRIYNKILEKIFNKLVNNFLPNYYLQNPSDNLHFKSAAFNGSNIIASVTSFPDRIKTTHLSIESIFRQSIKPEKIILWLAQEQFPNKEMDLPVELNNLCNKGLEIRFCDDIRSHKKYFYTLQEFKNHKVILFDDDLFFHKDVIKNLVDIHKKNPNAVVGTRVHKMKFKSGNLENYKNWEINYSGEEALLINHSNSGHGTLIPPSVKFDELFFDKNLFMKLSPKSDDVWLKVNLIRLGIPVVTNGVFARDTLSIKGTYKNSLVSDNTHKGLKDKQFKAVFDYFGIAQTEKCIKSFAK